MSDKQLQATPVDQLKTVMASPSVQQQFQNALEENSGIFVASLIDLFASDTYLQKCQPNLVVMEALKAATLKLPINKSLGFAYIVPYKGAPQFQLGYKGMVQLAMRSGVYKHLNADIVYEGELVKTNKLTGDIDLSGEKTSDKVVGYFSYIETVNGFRKTMYCSREDMEKHGQKYSASYSRKSSPWKKEFDGMAIKTMLRMLLGKYGLMTVDMADGMAMDTTKSREEVVLAICGYSFGDSHIDIEIEEALFKSKGRLTVAAFISDDAPQGILKKWIENPLITEQIRVYANKGFFHADNITKSADDDLPWWKFEVLSRLLGGER